MKQIILLLLGILLFSCTQEDSATAFSVKELPSWYEKDISKNIPSDRPLQAAFLIVDGVYNTELVAPFDLLQHVQYKTKPGIRVFTVSPEGGTVTTAEGLKIASDKSFESALKEPIDILIVPSADHSRDTDLQNQKMIRWVKQVGSKAQFVVSLCWGAFVLAEAGLLDKKHATTFPSDIDALAKRYPSIQVKNGPSFVHDGHVLTSQGGIRSFDVAMYLIDRLYGHDVAKSVGKGLIISWPPSLDAAGLFIESSSDF